MKALDRSLPLSLALTVVAVFAIALLIGWGDINLPFTIVAAVLACIWTWLAYRRHGASRQ